MTLFRRTVSALLLAGVLGLALLWLRPEPAPSPTPGPAVEHLPVFEIPAVLQGRWGGLTKEEDAQAVGLLALGHSQAQAFEARLVQPGLGPAQAEALVNDLLRLTLNLRALGAARAHGDAAFPAEAWQRLGPPTSAAMDGALSAVARAQARRPGCELADHQLWKVLPQTFLFEYAMARYAQGLPSCGLLPTQGLATLDAARLTRLRAAVGDPTQSAAHAEVVLAAARACQGLEDIASWQALGVCAWARQPEAVGRQLPLRRGQAWRRVELRPYVEDVRDRNQVSDWLERISAGNAEQRVASTVAALRAAGAAAPTNGYWISPRGDHLVFFFELDQHRPRPPGRPAYRQSDEPWQRYLAVVGAGPTAFLGVPTGLGQYDNGSVAAISDIDGDGWIEVWLAGEFGECEEGCPWTEYLRREQFGNDLALYVPGPRPAP